MSSALNKRAPRLVFLLLLLAALACFQQSRSELNSGKGSRKEPVAPRKYAVTPDFNVSALSVVRPLPSQQLTADSAPSEPASTAEAGDSAVPAEESLEFEYMKVQFQVKCNLEDEEICDLNDLRENLQLVSDVGVLFDPVSMIDDDPRLEGEILGGAEKTGWLIFRVPIGLPVTMAVAHYGEDQMVFFLLP